VTLNCLVNTIHQEIWPSPEKERAEAGDPSAATVRQTASCHFIKQNLLGMLFCMLEVPVSTRGFAFAPPFHW